MKRSTDITHREFGAGDLLLVLPPLLFAVYTIAYHFVLVLRLPAIYVGVISLPIMCAGTVWLFCRARVRMVAWRRTGIILLAFAAALAAFTTFIRKPNADDVNYFHRALYQLDHRQEPVSTAETTLAAQNVPAISFAHLATSYEFFVAEAGYALGLEPILCYHVLAPLLLAFYIPLLYFLFYRELGLAPMASVLAAAGLVVFLLCIDGGEPRSFGNVAFVRLWQGKTVLWTVLTPLTMLVGMKYLRTGAPIHAAALFACSVSSAGMSNSGIYLNPVLIGCLTASSVVCGLIETRQVDLRRTLITAGSMFYCAAYAILLITGVIDSPAHTDSYIQDWPAMWWQNLYLVIGDHWTLLRNVVLLFLPLVLLRPGWHRKMLVSYSAAAVLFCFNPIASQFWLHRIFPASYWRLLYLLPVPLCFGLLAAVFDAWRQAGSPLRRAVTLCAFVLGTAVTAVSFRQMPISHPEVSFKLPWQYQIHQQVVNLSAALGTAIDHHVVLTPRGLFTCELPLLNRTIRFMGCRYVDIQFADVGAPVEGRWRMNAQRFLNDADPKHAAAFRRALTDGTGAADPRRSGWHSRANAVIVPLNHLEAVRTEMIAAGCDWPVFAKSGSYAALIEPNDNTHRQMQDR